MEPERIWFLWLGRNFGGKRDCRQRPRSSWMAFKTGTGDYNDSCSKQAAVFRT